MLNLEYLQYVQAGRKETNTARRHTSAHILRVKETNFFRNSQKFITAQRRQNIVELRTGPVNRTQ